MCRHAGLKLPAAAQTGDVTFHQISCRRLRQEDEYTGQQLTEAGGLFLTGRGSGDCRVSFSPCVVVAAFDAGSRRAE